MNGVLFRFLSRRFNPPIISNADYVLRLPQISDHEEWRQLRKESYEFLQPWEPVWAGDDLSLRQFRARVRRNEREYSSGSAIPLFIIARNNNTLIGGITIGQIRRGAAQSCMIGYWMGKPHAGKGHMKAALQLVIHHIFSRLELHRIEAACIPENERSLRLLENAGFQREGLLREYLKINGRWREHVMLSLLAGDQMTPKKDNNGS